MEVYNRNISLCFVREHKKKLHNRNMFPLCIFKGVILEYGQRAPTWVVPLAKVLCANNNSHFLCPFRAESALPNLGCHLVHSKIASFTSFFGFWIGQFEILNYILNWLHVFLPKWPIWKERKTFRKDVGSKEKNISKRCRKQF